MGNPGEKRPKRAPGALTSISRALGGMRWAFLPLGIAALLAVGVHAAADSLCDRLLWVTDRIAEGFDQVMAHFDLTAPLVGAFSFAARTRVARGLTLAWELAADLAVALPALGYRDRSGTIIPVERTWRGMLRRSFTRPTTLRLIRPLETAAFALAGACAAAKMVQGSLFLSLHELVESIASPVSRFAALLALGAVAIRLGVLAVQRAVEHADTRSELEARTPVTRITAGLVGSAIALPLALAAVLDASPVLSFFR